MINSDYSKLINAITTTKPEYLLFDIEGSPTGFDFIEETLQWQVIPEKLEELKIIIKTGNINLPNHPQGIEIKLNYFIADEFEYVISELLKDQDQLYMLAFVGFKFLEKVPSVVKDLQNLRILQITHCGLQSIPTFVCELPFIELLSFHNNELQSIPTEIGKMANLTEIGVANNYISALPKEIGQLNKLTSLYLSRNKLTFLPDEIGELTFLQDLDLNHNKINKLPTEILFLDNLRRLDLRDNDLDIPPEILENVNEPKKILNYYAKVGASKILEIEKTTQQTLETVKRINQKIEQLLGSVCKIQNSS